LHFFFLPLDEAAQLSIRDASRQEAGPHRMIVNILDTRNASDGPKHLVHLIFKDGAAQYHATVSDEDIDGPWMAHEHAEVGANSIRNGFVVLVMRPMSEPGSGFPPKTGTAIPHVARRGIGRVTELAARLRRLILDHRPTPAPPVWIQEIHQKRSDSGSADNGNAWIHVVLLCCS
jgi:hypothetical protein